MPYFYLRTGMLRLRGRRLKHDPPFCTLPLPLFPAIATKLVAIGSNILGVAAVSLFPSGGHTVVVGISEGGGGQPTRPCGESRNGAQKRSGFMPVLASGKLSSRQAGNFWLPIFVLNYYTVALALKSGWHFCILSVFLAYIALCVYSFLHQLSLFCAALKWQ